MQASIEEILQEIEQKTERFESLHLRQNLDYEKFAIYSIVTHSTAIEGSTLTEQETEVLFENGLTAKGKPLLHHLMNTDLKNAYMFAMEQAKEKPIFSADFLKKLNALVMKSTGSIHSTLGGNFDNGKGDFRLCGVTAGIGGKSFGIYSSLGRWQRQNGKAFIFSEDRAEYIASLREFDETKDNSSFLNFMALEHLKTIDY